MKKQRSTSFTIQKAQFFFFASLVFAIPFVMVTRYLQGAVRTLSHFSIPLPWGEFKIVAFLFILLPFALLYVFRRKIDKLRIGAAIFCLLLILYAQQVQDLYINLSFFDLQQNWHYIAYMIYVFMFVRAFRTDFKSINSLISTAWGSAALLSLSDETFQLFMSHRTFDISDIAKDLLGATLGLIILLYIARSLWEPKTKRDLVPWRKNIGNYFKEPTPLVTLLLIFTLSIISISPLLTDIQYAGLVVILSIIAAILLFTVFHLLQFSRPRVVIIAITALISIYCGYSMLFAPQQITFAREGLILYKHVPVPFFDLLIYPDGQYRAVDKKHRFNEGDITFFSKQSPDILLIGSGVRGKGGQGFDRSSGTFFRFNPHTGKGMQVVILKTEEACKLYSSLISEGKRVLFVLHSTC